MGIRPSFARHAMPKTPLPSLVWDELAPRGVRSLFTPFTEGGSSLYAFKRYGLQVIGSDLLESAWRTTRALVQNNDARLSPEIIARFSRAPAPDLAEFGRFGSWVSRGFFDPDQAAWLGYWREAVAGLDGFELDLALVGISWMLDNWLKPLDQPGSTSSGPSALGLYLKRANQWVWDNGHANEARRGSPLEVSPLVTADACYLYLEPPLTAIDLKSWLLEAWLQGQPEADLGEFYSQNPFYVTADDYREVIGTLFESLAHIRIWAIQYRTEELDRFWGDHPSWLAGRKLLAQQHLGMGPDASGEMLCVAARE